MFDLIFLLQFLTENITGEKNFSVLGYAIDIPDVLNFNLMQY